MFGVSFTITGILAASMTQPTIFSVTARLLADGRAHAALAHAVRAAEIQLDAVRAGIRGALHEFMPAFARVHHQRGDHRAVRPALLDLGDFAEIGLRRTVADELDVVEARHARRSQIQRRIARGDVDDGIADGFPDHAAPARFERAMGLVSRVGRRAGGDPERIGRFDAGEIDGQISHNVVDSVVRLDQMYMVLRTCLAYSSSSSGNADRVVKARAHRRISSRPDARAGPGRTTVLVHRTTRGCRARLSCLRHGIDHFASAVGAIAAGENFGRLVCAGVHGREQSTPRLSSSSFGKGFLSKFDLFFLANRLDDHVEGLDQFRAGDNFGLAVDQLRARQLQAGDVPVASAMTSTGAALKHEFRAVGFGQVLFEIIGGHFACAAAINEHRFFGAKALGLRDGIDGGVAAADHSDAIADRHLVQRRDVNLLDEIQRLDDFRQILARNIQLMTAARPRPTKIASNSFSRSAT